MKHLNFSLKKYSLKNRKKSILLHLKTYNILNIKMSQEYIYLLREREFLNLNINICKFGRTSRGPSKRIDQYPKGSQIFLVIDVNNCINAEKEIKKEFLRLFIQKKDIGVEYFEGNINEMKRVVYDVAKKFEIDYSNNGNIKTPDLAYPYDSIYDEFNKLYLLKGNDNYVLSWIDLKKYFTKWVTDNKKNISSGEALNYFEKEIFKNKRGYIRFKNEVGEEKRLRGWRGYKLINSKKNNNPYEDYVDNFIKKNIESIVQWSQLKYSFCEWYKNNVSNPVPKSKDIKKYFETNVFKENEKVIHDEKIKHSEVGKDGKSKQ